AIDTLATVGPETCRVEDITHAAGTAKGNFYRHFPTFDDLLVGIRDHVLSDYRTQVEQRMAARDPIDWWQVVDEEIDAFLEFQVDLGQLHAVVFHGPAAQATPIGGDEGAATLVASLVRAGIEAGAFAPVDVEATATLIFHLLHGAADQITAGDDAQRIRNAVHAMIINSLRPVG
ncbi:MAG: TetR/AcrR family transcriptional regulator, partial [Actinomycetota bacterium]